MGALAGNEVGVWTQIDDGLWVAVLVGGLAVVCSLIEGG